MKQVKEIFISYPLFSMQGTSGHAFHDYLGCHITGDLCVIFFLVI